MKRKFKVLGVSLLAVFAMSTVAAQGAQGAGLTAESYPATLSGSQISTNVFKFTALGLQAECEVGKSSGSLASPGSLTITLSLFNEKCKAFGLASTIETEGCHFTTHISFIPPSIRFSLDIECIAGKLIKFLAGIIGNRCEIQIGTQTGLSGGEAFNKAGPPKDVELKTNITGITYKVTKDEGTCPLSKVGETFKDGDFTGNVTLTGSSGLFVSE